MACLGQKKGRHGRYGPTSYRGDFDAVGVWALAGDNLVPDHSLIPAPCVHGRATVQAFNLISNPSFPSEGTIPDVQEEPGALTVLRTVHLLHRGVVVLKQGNTLINGYSRARGLNSSWTLCSADAAATLACFALTMGEWLPVFRTYLDGDEHEYLLHIPIKHCRKQTQAFTQRRY